MKYLIKYYELLSVNEHRLCYEIVNKHIKDLFVKALDAIEYPFVLRYGDTLKIIQDKEDLDSHIVITEITTSEAEVIKRAFAAEQVFPFIDFIVGCIQKPIKIEKIKNFNIKPNNVSDGIYTEETGDLD